MWAFLETLGTAISEFASLAFRGPIDADVQTAHLRFWQRALIVLAVIAVLAIGTFLSISYGFHL